MPLAPAARAQESGGYIPMQTQRLDELFDALARAGPDDYAVIEDEIWTLWSDSGSPARDLLLARGRAALEADDPETAIEHFTALIDHSPDYAEGYNARATAYYLVGMIGPALADLRMALILEPRHFGALAGIGIILEELGQDQGALEAYRRVLAIHPNRADVLEGIARLEQRIEGRDT